ncbi:hypothetical protein D7X74_25965 [Corallococcus sp. CA047B]|uniref:hypothetical protein n=1 Tax=Corallococcus sp. CA047B TaxID=2316729 RepID=UPI000EA0FF36|nr:hypothetical protein [Corallococcus sp. CA047B]RKH11209.1 hypothetical protein D7X74_25965 [Corallococcus sp. CA047B]
MNKPASLLIALTCALLLSACGPSECTPDNCRDGCCSAENECMRYASDEACGPRGGGACLSCASGSVCHLGQRACIVGVMRTRVQPARATILPYDPYSTEDEEWDFDGTPPDVVVEMRCPSASGVFRTPEDPSLNPRWNSGGCEVLTSNLLKFPLEISIFDVDDFAFDDSMGTLTYQVTPEDLHFGRIELALPEAVLALDIDLSHTYSAE